MDGLPSSHLWLNTGTRAMAIQNQFRKPLVLSGVLLAFLAWPFMASAQLQKCTDPVTGKTTFSDRGCSSGEEMTSIRVAPANSIDGSQYRQQQADSSYPDANQFQQEAPSGIRVGGVGSSSDADRQRQKLCKEASTPHKGAHGLTVAQRAHAAQLCAGISLTAPTPHTAPAPAAAPAPAPAPAGITSCDTGGCWDTNGMRYNKGAGTTHFPANGGHACQLIGGQMICP